MWKAITALASALFVCRRSLFDPLHISLQGAYTTIRQYALVSIGLDALPTEGI